MGTLLEWTGAYLLTCVFLDEMERNATMVDPWSSKHGLLWWWSVRKKERKKAPRIPCFPSKVKVLSNYAKCFLNIQT
jgi:hypothetical protein